MSDFTFKSSSGSGSFPFLSAPQTNDSGIRRTFVDIGLKDGRETVAAVASGYTVYSFEPVPTHCRETMSALKEQHLDYHLVQLHPNGSMLEAQLPPPKHNRGVCYLFCVAAGATHGQNIMFVNGFASSFHDMRDAEHAHVQVVPVSNYVQTDVFFVKIDVQGHELDVLKGLRNLVNGFAVRMISVEFWPTGLELAGYSPNSLLQLLTVEYGFICFDMDPHNPLHEESLSGYLNHIHKARAIKAKRSPKSRWGWYVELVCLNVLKPYSVHHQDY